MSIVKKTSRQSRRTSVIDSNAVIAIEHVVIVKGVIIPSHIVPISVERENSRRVQVVRRIDPVIMHDVIVAFKRKIPCNRLADLHVSDDGVVGIEAEAMRSERETTERGHILCSLPPLLSTDECVRG